MKNNETVYLNNDLYWKVIEPSKRSILEMNQLGEGNYNLMRVSCKNLLCDNASLFHLCLHSNPLEFDF